MVIIQVTGYGSLQQAAEVVEAVAIVAAYRGIKGRRQPVDIIVVIEIYQQALPLMEDLDHRLNQLLAGSRQCQILAL